MGEFVTPAMIRWLFYLAKLFRATNAIVEMIGTVKLSIPLCDNASAMLAM